MPRGTKYYPVRSLGYIGICAACSQDICAEEGPDWKINFVLEHDADGQRRLHSACLPEGVHLSHPRRALDYWDWQTADRPDSRPV